MGNVSSKSVMSNKNVKNTDDSRKKLLAIMDIVAANYANIEDGIFESGEWLTGPDYSGYAFGYSLETFLGPLEGKYTYSPETRESYWFFNLGFWF